MRSFPYSLLGVSLITLALAGAVQAQELQNPVEVQKQGPLHEAFAQPFDPSAGPNAIVPKAPPAPINELPPDRQPEAENTQWIPGYWAWDAQRQDFTWVGGVSRVPPQGRKYEQGYWSREGDSWRWVTGFWSAATQQTPVYTPAPPASLENGPSMPAPEGGANYVPGGWVYRDQRFLWQPGYYASAQQGRVWNPPHYVWTPAGYAFVDGYWDYPLESRGVAYAPLNFASPVYNNPGWSYQPSYAIDPLAFLDSAYALGNNFYFGNYYGPNYSRFGYRPWYAGVGRYDPTLNYYGSNRYGRNGNWLSGVQQSYANRGNGVGLAGVTSLNNLARTNGLRLAATSPAQLASQQSSAQQSRALATSRSQRETSGPVIRTAQATPAPRAAAQVLTFAKSSPAPATRTNAAVANTVRIVQPAVTSSPRIAATTQAPRPASHPVVHAAHAPTSHASATAHHTVSHSTSHGGGGSHHSGGHR